MQALASLLCGLVFGCGLLISGMTQPQKVLGFLDILGRWDPTLAFVMAGALALSGAGYALARRFRAPIFAAQYSGRPGATSIGHWLQVRSCSVSVGGSSDCVRGPRWKTS
jgi:uncharacterized membrane protein YedE/YeeE